MAAILCRAIIRHYAWIFVTVIFWRLRSKPPCRVNECKREWVLKKYVSGRAFSAASAAAKFFFSLFG
jgi:hypothetical protein